MYTIPCYLFFILTEEKRWCCRNADL